MSDIRFATPLGAVFVHVSDSVGRQLSERLRLQVSADDVQPQLPPGMRVDHAVRIELRMRALEDGVAPRVLFALDETRNLKGNPSSGQWLETVQFERGGTILSLGARDQEWSLTYGVKKSMLPNRFQWADPDIQPDGYELTYAPYGMIIDFGTLARGESVKCPLALAYVSGLSGSDDDVWTWFGVDAVLP